MAQWRSRPLARDRNTPAGFIFPCQPVLSAAVPRGPEWGHELKHDGWRIVARKSGAQVRLWTRQANDQAATFPAITNAVRMLPVTSVVLDGEAVTHDAQGWPHFHALHSKEGARKAVLFAFDLLELDGEDLRGRPLEQRRKLLDEVLFEPLDGLKVSELFEGDGQALFRHACALNLEGIVSKRRNSRYRSGRSDDWHKIKCPAYARGRTGEVQCRARPVKRART